MDNGMKALVFLYICLLIHIFPINIIMIYSFSFDSPAAMLFYMEQNIKNS